MTQPPTRELTHRHPAFEGLLTPRARASLLVEAEDDVHGIALIEDAPLVIGRAPFADVVIDHHSLSRLHARFSLQGGAVVVEDLQSTNGVVLDGERVAKAQLTDGDSVSLGSVRVTVSGLGSPAEPARIQSWARFRAALEGEIARATTFARSFSVLGLRAPATERRFEALQSLLRDVDVATRYTPDLALVLLPETSPSVASEIARKLVERLAEGAAAAVSAYPDDAAHFEAVIESVVHAARAAKPGAVARATPSAQGASDGPVILSEAMQRLYGLVERIAKATLPVLVQGETGAGKELVARAVHDKSARAKGPFVAMNCASIPTSLVESVLFGHEKGAFTGATERRIGVFEQASGGSVFLDEVGELGPSVQAALLRVLETKRLTRVGGTKEIELDVRVIAATHRDLAAMVANGSFREDLLFRLDALSLRVPPLRERVEEIEPLAERFLAQARAQWNAASKHISPEARALLRRYRWPGNVRQLKNVIERAAVICVGDTIGLDELPDALLGTNDAAPTMAPPPEPMSTLGPHTAEASADDDPSLPFEERVRAFESRVIRDALAKTGGNQTKAAALLRLPRRTLTNKVHALGLGSGRERDE